MTRGYGHRFTPAWDNTGSTLALAVAPANSLQPTDKLSGLIDRVTYFNEESGFAVLKEMCIRDRP